MNTYSYRKKANEKIRKAAEEKRVRLWEIAERFGVNDVLFSKKLRHEFSEEDTARALRYIDEIAAGINESKDS